MKIKDDFEIKIFHSYFSLQSETFSNCRKETTPNPAEWVSDVVFLFTNAEWRGFCEQEACWEWRFFGGTAPCRCCDYRWLWGGEGVLVWVRGLREDASLTRTLCTCPASKCHSEFILTTCISTSSRGWLWLRRHDNPSRLARPHAGQNWHGHSLCSADAHSVDGGSGAGDRGRWRWAVLDDRRRGADGFGGRIPGGVLSSCS